VAKRVRGQRASHRVGGQAAPLRRHGESAGTAGAVPGPSSDVDSAIDSVLYDAMYDAELTIEEPATTAVAMKPRRTTRVRADSLEARVAAESIYVRDDLRRILLVSVVLFAALAVCWFVFVFLNILDLY
jgi:hypothetical protein